jgi:hexosaminidase
MGANGVEPGCYDNTFSLINTGTTALEGNWVIYYNQLSGTPVHRDDDPLKAERIMSTYFKLYPTDRYQTLAVGDTLKFTFLCRGGLIKEGSHPYDPYIVFTDLNGNEKTPQNVPLQVVPFERAEQWTRPGTQELPYPDGRYVYAQNEFFSEPVELDEYDIFPSLKSIEKKEGSFLFPKTIRIESAPDFENEANLLQAQLQSLFGCSVSDEAETVIELVCVDSLKNKNANEEQYEIDLQDRRICISGSYPHGIFNGCQTLLNVLGNVGELPATLTNAHIKDYPDTHHRGIMLDVARNFTRKENVLKLIDRLAAYKLNIFHWHLTDDEAWRLEIPGLEELTTVGARRGHTHDESTCLYPAFAWGWNAQNTNTLANGYYTRNDFIEVLQYAHQRHIQVIPEVEMPGHARAAIKAMNARYKHYIDIDKEEAEKYLLVDFADTSRYNSAQNFTDNVLNVALPSTYRFMEKVIDEFDKMYAEAGLELTLFHIGGDEVPRGAWEGSAVCRELMQTRGMTEIRDLKDYFLAQVLPMLAERNIQPAGWEEVAMHDGVPNPKFADSNVLSYCWTTLHGGRNDQLPYKLANAGYPIILCNVTNLYMDMSYNRHPSEPGLHWGGFVDEYNSFDLLPYDLYRSIHHNLSGEPVDMDAFSRGKVALAPKSLPQIKGLQGQQWAETIRSYEQVEYNYFPKLFGLIERAWNIRPAWSTPYDEQQYTTAKREYSAKIARYELPRLSKAGANFRIAQPGILLKEGLLYANSTLPDAVIRYTLDGSEPTETSLVWTAPVACYAPLVKAKAFYLGKQSVTTRLDNSINISQ